MTTEFQNVCVCVCVCVCEVLRDVSELCGLIGTCTDLNRMSKRLRGRVAILL